jgi:hypothetical protein
VLAIALVFASVFCSAAASSAQDVHERFEELREKLTRQLKSQRTTERLSALKTLERFPTAGAVKLVHGCFEDEDEEVRRAAYAVLHELNNTQEVCDELVTLAEAHLRSAKDAEMAQPALAALLSSELPLARCRTQMLLDRKLTSNPRGTDILINLADNLGAHGETMDVLPLARLANCRLFAEQFGVRRAVAQALAKTPPTESTPVLIGMLDKLGGEAKADAAGYLTRTTGQRFGMETARWQGWLAETSGTPLPKRETPARLTATIQRAEEVESEGGHYYGMPIYANKLLFVLDISGSMQGARFIHAKRELLQAIHGLRPDVKFGIIVFNSSVGRWQQHLVVADDRQKKLAERFVEGLNPQASTATFDALAAALEYDVEAIYFLTDGAPTGGQIVAPPAIVQSVSGTNRNRRISIYTIGLAPGAPGSMTDEFLKVLAEQNLGTYRRIDG